MVVGEAELFIFLCTIYTQVTLTLERGHWAEPEKMPDWEPKSV